MVVVSTLRRVGAGKPVLEERPSPKISSSARPVSDDRAPSGAGNRGLGGRGDGKRVTRVVDGPREEVDGPCTTARATPGVPIDTAPTGYLDIPRCLGTQSPDTVRRRCNKTEDRAVHSRGSKLLLLSGCDIIHFALQSLPGNEVRAAVYFIQSTTHQRTNRSQSINQSGGSWP